MIHDRINIFWFRRDLRTVDNHGLYRALSAPCPVLPVFIFDTRILDPLERDDARISFIYKQLEKIQGELRQTGSSLLVAHGTPVEIFGRLLSEYPVDTVFANEDYEPYGIERDRAVADTLRSSGVSLKLFRDHLVFAPGEVMKADGTPYTVYTPFMRKWRQLFNPLMVAPFPSEQLFSRMFRIDLTFPGMEEFGFRRSSIEVIPPDLSEKMLVHYHEYRDRPDLDATSGLGPHLRFGTVSIRSIVGRCHSRYDIFLNELIWREFFSHILYHFPEVVNKSFRKGFDRLPWRNIPGEIDRWMTGNTGFPMVDAGMRQLLATGFMHNRVRMITASFLVKDLLVDWRIGEAFFARHLVDYELASNNGNWQWAAGTGCDAAPFFRIFNPTEQQKRYDPGFEFTRKWVPEWDTSSYPVPMIRHDMARKRALEIYKTMRSGNLLNDPV